MSQPIHAIGTAVKGLKPCKRYIATHDSSGKSVYAESPEQVFNAAPGVGGVARSFAVGSVPANLTDDADIKAYRAEEGSTSYTGREIVPPTTSGANLLVIDLAPGAVSAMYVSRRVYTWLGFCFYLACLIIETCADPSIILFVGIVLSR